MFGDLASGRREYIPFGKSLRRMGSRGSSALRTENLSFQRAFVQYPLLVRFRELTLAGSLEAVAPDALDQAFGPGVKLKRITAPHHG
jgi:hypothetical protein